MLNEILGLLSKVFNIVFNLGQQDTIMIVILFFVLIIIGLKVFQYLLKALMTGIAFGLFPLIANFLGIQVPLTISSIIWFTLFGIAMFFLYSAVSTGVKIFKLILSPFSVLFRKKEKKYKEKKEKKKEK